jgi:hypothetical protein
MSPINNPQKGKGKTVDYSHHRVGRHSCASRRHAPPEVTDRTAIASANTSAVALFLTLVMSALLFVDIIRRLHIHHM